MNFELIVLELVQLNRKTLFLKPFSFFDSIKRKMEALVILSDGGAIIEDASLRYLLSNSIRDLYERSRGMEADTLAMSGLKSCRILDSSDVNIAQHCKILSEIFKIRNYEAGSILKQVLRMVLSYFGYINRAVWSKPV